MERIKKFFKDESGVSAVEYVLLLALLAAGVAAAITTFYGTLSSIFSGAATNLASQGGS